MNAYLVGIIAGIPGAILLAAIAFALKSRWAQPKLRVRILHPGLGDSTQGNAGKLALTWHKRMEIYNTTPIPASAVSYIWPDTSRQLPLPRLEHLVGLEIKILDFKIEREFPAEEVIAYSRRGGDRFAEFQPAELREILLVLQYQNDAGISFYTRYENNNGTEKCTFHRSKPQ